MKRKFLFLIAALTLLIPSTHAQRIKVACVGNSITFGHGIVDREHNHYPAQLQAYLGDAYEVRNFGVSATTLTLKGDFPYVTTDQYKASLEWQPDIVIIKFGTNDTKSKNWIYRDQFKHDYETLIASYRTLPSHPRIILLTPIRCFLPLTDWDIRGDYVEQFIKPQVEQIAYDNQLDIINMHNLLGDTWDAGLLPDKLHPSALGAGRMALKIYNYLQRPAVASQPADSTIPFYKQGATAFNFHGYQGYDFQLNGVACKVVEPKTVAEGKPWIWRARFWGHEPQTDVDLLERGFHVVYCDVADLYGAPAAVERWNMFYKQMQKAGFSKQAVLEGMSRGGLIIYNWAARNPKKVACIYADAPVMDIKQWPMGPTGNEDDKAKMLKAYNFPSEEAALAWHGNPIDHAAIMAKAGIPILHVVGDADASVRYKDNTLRFENAMRKLGKPIRVIHKPSVGHHPHSLNNPEPIVDVILQATKQ